MIHCSLAGLFLCISAIYPYFKGNIRLPHIDGRELVMIQTWFQNKTFKMLSTFIGWPFHCQFTIKCTIESWKWPCSSRFGGFGDALVTISLNISHLTFYKDSVALSLCLHFGAFIVWYRPYSQDPLWRERKGFGGNWWGKQLLSPNPDMRWMTQKEGHFYSSQKRSIITYWNMGYWSKWRVVIQFVSDADKLTAGVYR